MDDVKQFSGDNIGGLLRLNFIPVSDIESIDEPYEHRITVPVELKENKRWFSLYATLGTMSFTESGSKTSDGELFDKKITATCPKDRADISALFNEMRNEQFVIDYTDTNGERKLVGSLEEPLQFSSNLNTKEGIEGRNEHVISFFGVGTHKSYFYDI